MTHLTHINFFGLILLIVKTTKDFFSEIIYIRFQKLLFHIEITILQHFQVSYKKIVIQTWRVFSCKEKYRKKHLLVFTSGFQLNSAFCSKRSDLEYIF